MKINPNSGLLSDQYAIAQQGAARAAQPQARAQGAPEDASRGGDRVSMSSSGRLLAEASRAAHAAPDLRAERIASLRAQVQSGAYAVDSARLAADILREEPGLLAF